MKSNNLIIQITISGVLTSLAIIFGGYFWFPLLGGRVYLIGLFIFLMPLFLKWKFALISAIIAVVFADLISGWIFYTWISIIAYGGAVIIISTLNIFRNIVSFAFSIVLASIFACITYYILEIFIFDKALALNDLMATSIQFTLVSGVSLSLYFPLKIFMRHK